MDWRRSWGERGEEEEEEGGGGGARNLAREACESLRSMPSWSPRGSPEGSPEGSPPPPGPEACSRRVLVSRERRRSTLAARDWGASGSRSVSYSLAVTPKMKRLCFSCHRLCFSFSTLRFFSAS